MSLVSLVSIHDSRSEAQSSRVGIATEIEAHRPWLKSERLAQYPCAGHHDIVYIFSHQDNGYILTTYLLYNHLLDRRIHVTNRLQMLNEPGGRGDICNNIEPAGLWRIVSIVDLLVHVHTSNIGFDSWWRWYNGGLV